MNIITYIFEKLIDSKALFSTAFGAFIGAVLAFYINEIRDRKKAIKANIAAARKAQFVIYSHYNSLLNIKKNYLEPHRGKNEIERAFVLTPLSDHSRYESVSFDSISFMLEDDGANILMQLMICEQHFFSLLGTMEQRNVRHERFQIELARQGIVDVVPKEVIGTVIDSASVKILVDMTNSIYGLVDDGVNLYLKASNDIQHYLKKRFPKDTRLNFIEKVKQSKQH